MEQHQSFTDEVWAFRLYSQSLVWWSWVIDVHIYFGKKSKEFNTAFVCWSTLRTKKILSSPQILNEGGGRYCKALPCQLRTKSDFSDQYTYLILYCNKHKALQRSTDISSTRSERNGSLCLLIKISEARDKALVLKWPKFVYSLITEAIITPKVPFAYKDSVTL